MPGAKPLAVSSFPAQCANALVPDAISESGELHHCPNSGIASQFVEPDRHIDHLTVEIWKRRDDAFVMFGKIARIEYGEIFVRYPYIGSHVLGYRVREVPCIAKREDGLR